MSKQEYADAGSVGEVFDSAMAQDAYARLVRIRQFEDKVHESFVSGLVHGTTHLCQGQEAVSVGSVMALRDDDYLTYTYRGHGPCVARGMSLEAAFAEIFGRATGISGGLGGSMHLTDMELGLIGSFAIVGAGLPVAVGAAISARQRGQGQLAITYFGDGSTNIGGFHESMNLAAVWKLPVIFICENNLYGEYSPILSTTPMMDLAVRADSYAMPAAVVDGNDPVAVYQATQRAGERARGGGGPTFIECKTYRQCGHSRSDPAKYRPPGELDSWVARDPIPRFRESLIAEALADARQLDDIDAAVAAEIDAAAAAAAEAPWPEIRDFTAETYAGTYTQGGR
ncbi:MAG: thiamine pyrophosphate-dependent dehydrogenase E1 component subunit alpha [Gammaproteobacteria bacterium]|nr:thiamine pyrophosphate-dependent dehydrogenase E1 component subunit alpha [Gammaproteobacteria bacterium]NNM00490.1 thiamine pyrophosphate-dependent dehydrogenase E1 component subunit alpha [Gammaproteobacteria bacterium]